MAVKKIEAAARRLVKKIAALALGEADAHAASDIADEHGGTQLDATRAETQLEKTRAETRAPAPKTTSAAAGESTEQARAQAATHEVDAVSEDKVTVESAGDRAAATKSDGKTETSPIRTRTLARLLAEQGHPARALLIYEELIAASPGDLTLVREAHAVGAQQSDRDAGPTIEAVRAPAALYGSDQITAAIVDANTLFVHWEVTDAGTARARSVAESAGRSAGEPATLDALALTLRIVVLRADRDGVVRSEAIERTAPPAGGETFVTGLPADATLFAAVGVRRGERFVAITHAAAAYTPPSVPAELPALAFAPAPPAPSSPLDHSPPVPPIAAPISAPAAVTVLRQAEALRQPTPWPHSSDLDFRATSSR